MDCEHVIKEDGKSADFVIWNTVIIEDVLTNKTSSLIIELLYEKPYAEKTVFRGKTVYSY